MTAVYQTIGTNECPDGAQVRLALLLNACDIPAARKTSGFTSHASTCACHKCARQFPVFPGTSDIDYSGINLDEWELRTREGNRENAQQWRQAETLAARRQIERDTGTRWSELHRLEYFDPVRCTIIDPMHNLFLGTAKRMTKMWIENGDLTRQDLCEMQVLADSIVLPPDYVSLKRKIGAGFSFMTADDWKSWCIVYSPFVLQNHLPRHLLAHWLSFVNACRLLVKPSVTMNEIEGANHYFDWCAIKDLNPEQCTWQQRLACLADLCTQGLSINTLRSVRTAISACTPDIQGTAFSELREVREFMKGASNLHPPAPRDRTARWDISLLVAHLASMAPLDQLSLKDCGRKVHALLCIVTGWRPGSDMSKILSSVLIRPSSNPAWPAEMQLTAVDVKEGGNKISPFIPCLTEDQAICPVWWTYQYLQRTQPLRHNTTRLFVAATAPHQALSPDRLRNWLQVTMREAGIDPQFTAHSIRAESATTALEAGASIEEVLAAGNWSSRTTFERHYYLMHRDAMTSNSRARTFTYLHLNNRTRRRTGQGT